MDILPFQTAQARWNELDGERQSFVRRCEQYAAYTIPKLCLPNGYDQALSLKQDYQSVGAQCVNHLANKLMLALFAPSRPFFRLDPGTKAQAELAEKQADMQQVAQQLSVAERNAVKLLDQESMRPKLYELVKHLTVTGNALLWLDKKKIRVLGLKSYVTKRAPDGQMVELIVMEKVHKGTLDAKVRMALPENECGPKGIVTLYRWIKLNPVTGKYDQTTWVGNTQLATEFSGSYAIDALPFHAVTWDLADGNDYGTGHVEDFEGDFAGLSILSEATIQAAVLASEFRWLVNPAGQTRPEDLMASRNGAALPGVQGDITLVQSGKSGDLQVNINIASQYINRIGAGFLLQSAVTRDAERVTAEEIRMTAEELENSLGGAYSRIAVDLQRPLAFWLLKRSGADVTGTDFIPTIVTGLAALSRLGDRDNLVLFIQDLTGLSNIQPDVRARLKLTSIINAFASARSLLSSEYVLSEQEVAQMQQQQQAAANQQMAVEQAIQTQGQEQ